MLTSDVQPSQNQHFNILLKVIPQYCIAHPYCAQFLASLACAMSARTLTKGHFLLNEHGDLSFFLLTFDEIIIFFNLNEFLKNSSSGKNVSRKTCAKSLFVGAKL